MLVKVTHSSMEKRAALLASKAHWRRVEERPRLSEDGQAGNYEQDSVHQWLMTSCQEQVKSYPDLDTSEPLKRQTSGEDDLVLGVEASLYGKNQELKTARQVLRRQQAAPLLTHCNSLTSVTSAHSAALSVMDVLNLWNDDPEELLLELGFGSEEPDISVRIPARFINHQSKARGINIQVFLEAQKNRLDVENPDVGNRFRQIEVLQQVTSAFSALVPPTPPPAPSSKISPTSQERRRRLGMLLRRASKKTLSKSQSQPSPPADPSANQESDPPDRRSARKLSRPGPPESSGLTPLEEEQSPDASRDACDPPAEPWLGRDPPCVSPRAPLRRKSPVDMKTPESFEIEEIHSFDEGSAGRSAVEFGDTAEARFMRTNSCQSDSSGFLEEPVIPGLSQQPSPVPQLMKALHNLSGDSTDSQNTIKDNSDFPCSMDSQMTVKESADIPYGMDSQMTVKESADIPYGMDSQITVRESADIPYGMDSQITVQENADIPYGMDSQMTVKESADIPYGMDSQITVRESADIPYGMDSQITVQENADIPYGMDSQMTVKESADIPYGMDSQMTVKESADIPYGMDSQMTVKESADIPYGMGSHITVQESGDIPYGMDSQITVRESADIPYDIDSQTTGKENLDIPYSVDSHISVKEMADIPYDMNAHMTVKENVCIPFHSDSPISVNKGANISYCADTPKEHSDIHYSTDSPTTVKESSGSPYIMDSQTTQKGIVDIFNRMASQERANESSGVPHNDSPVIDTPYTTDRPIPLKVYPDIPYSYSSVTVIESADTPYRTDRPIPLKVYPDIPYSYSLVTVIECDDIPDDTDSPVIVKDNAGVPKIMDSRITLKESTDLPYNTDSLISVHEIADIPCSINTRTTVRENADIPCNTDSPLTVKECADILCNTDSSLTVKECADILCNTDSSLTVKECADILCNTDSSLTVKECADILCNTDSSLTVKECADIPCNTDSSLTVKECADIPCNTDSSLTVKECADILCNTDSSLTVKECADIPCNTDSPLTVKECADIPDDKDSPVIVKDNAGVPKIMDSRITLKESTDLPYNTDSLISVHEIADIPCSINTRTTVRENADIPCNTDSPLTVKECADILCNTDSSLTVKECADILCNTDSSLTVKECADILCNTDSSLTVKECADIPCNTDSPLTVKECADIPCSAENGICANEVSGFPSNVDSERLEKENSDLPCRTTSGITIKEELEIPNVPGRQSSLKEESAVPYRTGSDIMLNESVSLPWSSSNDQQRAAESLQAAGLESDEITDRDEEEISQNPVEQMETGFVPNERGDNAEENNTARANFGEMETGSRVEESASPEEPVTLLCSKCKKSLQPEGGTVARSRGSEREGDWQAESTDVDFPHRGESEADVSVESFRPDWASFGSSKSVSVQMSSSLPSVSQTTHRRRPAPELDLRQELADAMAAAAMTHGRSQKLSQRKWQRRSASLDTGLAREEEQDREEEVGRWEAGPSAGPRCCCVCDHRCSCCSRCSRCSCCSWHRHHPAGEHGRAGLQLLHQSASCTSPYTFSLDELEGMMRCMRKFRCVQEEVEEQLQEQEAQVYSDFSDLDRQDVASMQVLRAEVKREAELLEMQLTELGLQSDTGITTKMQRLLDEQSHLCMQLRIPFHAHHWGSAHSPQATPPGPVYMVPSRLTGRSVATQCCLLPDLLVSRASIPEDLQRTQCPSPPPEGANTTAHAVSAPRNPPDKQDLLALLGFFQSLKDSLRHSSVNSDCLE